MEFDPKMFESAILVQIRNKTLGQDCICQSNPTGDNKLLENLFRVVINWGAW